ncbi:hypothetical protein [Antrihabitans spumae]|jgi:hypothetical protein|uniref:Rho termination factor N-terminal domain-containing protein n=1 Tax=Antrihabitans spumae TaxID=3373370 RepID=A0ABW7K9X2_9NOCA
MAEYILTADQFDQIVSEPGAPLAYKRYGRGDVVTIDDAEDAARLLKAGAIRSADQPEVVAPEPVSSPPAPADPNDISTGPKGPVPPKTGLKELWVEYAVDNGMTESDAEALSKQELIAKFGTGSD